LFVVPHLRAESLRGHKASRKVKTDSRRILGLEGFDGSFDPDLGSIPSGSTQQTEEEP